MKILLGALAVAFSFTGTIAAAATSTTGQHYQTLAFDKSDGAWGMDTDIAGCKRTPDMPWCIDSGFTPGTRPLNLAVLREVTNLEKEHMIVVNGDDAYWESSADKVLAGQKFRGDCDDAVMTAIDLLARRGYDISKVWRSTAAVKSAKPNHVVAIAQVGDDYWVFADSFGFRTTKLTAIDYRLGKAATGLSMQWYPVV